MQLVAETLDTLSKLIDVVPAGMTGSIWLHDVPFQNSAMARAGPGPPTATQYRVVTHDTPAAAASVGRGIAGSFRQVWPHWLRPS